MVSATITVVDVESRGAMLEALGKVRAATLLEPGVLEYRFTLDPTDPHVVHALEMYQSEQAVETHLLSPHVTKFLSSVGAIGADVAF